MKRLETLLDSAGFQRTIMAIIILNAIVLGLETGAAATALAGPALMTIDRICLGIFVVELLAKIVAFRARFLRDPWNVFDAIVVAIALTPASEGLSVLRALRVLRAFRLISAVPAMRRVVAAFLAAIPSMGAIVALLLLVFYVFSVMAAKLFGPAFPDWFGSVGASAYTLFQIMTLESWSMGIVRPVMETFPLAWIFFVPFILVTSFMVLNLFIGVIVEAIQSQTAEDAENREAREYEAMREELRALRREIGALRAERGGDPRSR